MSNPNKAIKPKASEGTEPAKEGVDPETFRTNPEEAKAATEAHTSQFFLDLEKCRLSEDDTSGLGVGHGNPHPRPGAKALAQAVRLLPS